MNLHPSTSREAGGFASGMRTAIVVVVLGTLAVVADHAFFIAPYAVTPAAAAVAPAALAADVSLPASLHPTSADVAPQAPTF